MKRIIYLLLLVVVVLAGCKSSKHLATSETKTSTKAPTSSYLASKLQLTIPGKKGSMSVGGTMKMKTHERAADKMKNNRNGEHDNGPHPDRNRQADIEKI